MYKCNDCKRSFEDPYEVVEDPGEGGLRGCPHCGGTSIVDLTILAEMFEERGKLGDEP